MVCATMLFLSCKDEEVINPAAPSGKEDVSASLEVAYPDQRGIVKKGFYLGNEVTYEEINGDYILEGDMILNKKFLTENLDDLILDSNETAHSFGVRSVGLTGGRWPNNTVYYSIASNLPNQYRVTDAITHWEANTNLKFVQRTNQQNYVYFRPVDQGCSADLGMKGGMQYVNLEINCSTGTVIHEIGHTVGLFHEQSRSDRDSYLRINWDYIQEGMAFNFYTYQEQHLSGADYTSALDYNSIMLYGSYAFSKYGQGYPTITKLDGSTYQSNREYLSQGDIAGLNVMYPGDNGGGDQYVNGNYYTLYGLRVYRHDDKWWYWVQAENKWKEVEYVDGAWRYVDQGDNGGGNQYQNGTNYTIHGVTVFRDQDRWWYLTNINGANTYISIDDVNGKWVWNVNGNIYKHNTYYNVDGWQVLRYNGKWWRSYYGSWNEVDYVNGKWEYV